MRAGELECIVTTSALELGIDIGALDISLLNGYPSTIAGTWQRLGRAGRRNRPALGVLIATSSPLQYCGQFCLRGSRMSPHLSKVVLCNATEKGGAPCDCSKVY